MFQNVDNLQSSEIRTNPTNLKGEWTQILCLTNCTGVVIDDTNLITGSELWSDAEFIKTSIITGLFKEVTLVGKVVLYA
jgi:hypothetical protein